jgi:hypothetical protein
MNRWLIGGLVAAGVVAWAAAVVAADGGPRWIDDYAQARAAARAAGKPIFLVFLCER